ncbi:CPBP family intramembrane metalloprotease [Microbulbifer salipaludis]|uniref:CPBP family intramembrane metalloprotease n=1 Tax=Microbulbifer salipaludis TaxID=187980 RepID=A0ABS3E1V1_9GAMM|nr:CPBP family intramembrane glutamic endopeptidase [Microbulbifer salipaludis]MBN8429270.1 CPBP family intramembrane metalloprotease [Microbulbifer salipaludis]
MSLSEIPSKSSPVSPEPAVPSGGYETQSDDPVERKSHLWFSINWLIGFLILHGVGSGIYLQILRARGAAIDASQFPDSLALEFLPGLGLFSWALVLPALALAGRSLGGTWRQGLGLVRFRPGLLLTWLGIMVVYLLGEWLVILALGLEMPEFMTQMVGRTELSLILAIVVLAPVTEELLFRGYLFNAWRHSALGLVGTLFLTSLLFSLLHWGQYDITVLAFIFCFSIVVGLAREKSGSTWLPIILHAFANLTSVITVNFLGWV